MEKSKKEKEISEFLDDPDKSKEKVKKKSIKEVLKENDIQLVKTKDLEQQIRANSEVTDVFNPTVWDQFRGMAKTLMESGALPQGSNAAQVMVKMQAGYEMGMKPFEAIRSLYIVNGMIAIGGRDLIKQLRKHGWKIQYIDESDDAITGVVTKNGEEYTDIFTFEEAQKSGWTKGKHGLKPGWMEGANRNLKMRYAVISKIVKSYLPEVMGTATDVAEVMVDTVPIYENGEVEIPVSNEDMGKINSAETFQELTKVTRELKGKYKLSQLEPLYRKRREELEDK